MEIHSSSKCVHYLQVQRIVVFFTKLANIRQPCPCLSADLKYNAEVARMQRVMRDQRYKEEEKPAIIAAIQEQPKLFETPLQ